MVLSTQIVYLSCNHFVFRPYLRVSALNSVWHRHLSAQRQSTVAQTASYEAIARVVSFASEYTFNTYLPKQSNLAYGGTENPWLKRDGCADRRRQGLTSWRLS